MSSFSRRAFLISAVTLAGCGFSPAYGPSGAAQALRGAVTVAEPQTREDYSYARALAHAFGPADAPRYRLAYTIETDESPVSLTRAQEIYRYHIRGSATYALVENASGATLASGQVSAFTAYAATGSTVASLSATRDAYARLMQQLADRTVSELVIAMADAR